MLTALIDGSSRVSGGLRPPIPAPSVHEKGGQCPPYQGSAL